MILLPFLFLSLLISQTQGAQLDKRYTSHGDIYLLTKTSTSFQDFLEFANLNQDQIEKSQLRKELALYLKKKLFISGYNQDPSHFEQNTEDITLFLSQKTAKDIIIGIVCNGKVEGCTDYLSLLEVKEMLFKETKPRIDDQRPALNVLQEYSNLILSSMQDYILNKIQHDNLIWEQKERLVEDREEIKLRNEGAGLEPMSYFLFRLIYDNNRRYTFENLSNYADFSEYIPYF